MENKTFCRYCWPSNKNHFENKVNSLLDFYLGKPLEYIFALPIIKNIFQLIVRILKFSALQLSLFIKHATLDPTINRVLFDNCILVFWDEAKRRKMNIYNLKIGNTQTQIFRFEHNEKNYYFDRNPIYPNVSKLKKFKDAARYDDKIFFKKFLLKHHFPYPAGKSFISPKHAFKYGVQLGFPLVVKPVKSSSSIHVSFNIKTQQQLLEAITIAKQVNYQIIVEKYIPGDVHRVIVIDDELIACTKRQPGRIVGNGKNTVKELIDEKNNHPWRGKPNQLDCTLHKVEINNELIKLLAKQKVTLKTKLKKGQAIVLAHKMNVGNGGDLINVTSIIHPENRLLFKKLFNHMKIPMLGLDFICEDISVPWNKQHFGIIENNSLPGIGIHHYPSSGEPINVAGITWNFVLNKIDSNFIYPQI